jgi:hypothetical protein
MHSNDSGKAGSSFTVYSCSKSLYFTGTDPRGGLFRKPLDLRGAITPFHCSLEAEAKILSFFRRI